MRKLSRLYRFYQEYGYRCFAARLFSELFPYTKQKSAVRNRILQHKFDVYIGYLSKYYQEWRTDAGEQDADDAQCSGHIWTAWLQGENNAPEVIRLNLASVRKNAGGHPVVVISNDNVDQYVSIPQTIKEKYRAGILGQAHYADVVRMLLLAKYGGLWLDASVFLYHPIDEHIFISPFYSVGFQADKGPYVSDHKWLVGVIGGGKNSRYVTAISRMLSMYWEEHDVPLDYFVFDYLIAVLYRNDLSFRAIVDQLPRMRFFTNSLKTIINEPYDQDAINGKIPDGQICCLSYRDRYQKITEEGQMTNYGFLCHELLGE